MLPRIILSREVECLRESTLEPSGLEEILDLFERENYNLSVEEFAKSPFFFSAQRRQYEETWTMLFEYLTVFTARIQGFRMYRQMGNSESLESLWEEFYPIREHWLTEIYNRSVLDEIGWCK